MYFVLHIAEIVHIPTSPSDAAPHHQADGVQRRPVTSGGGEGGCAQPAPARRGLPREARTSPAGGGVSCGQLLGS